MSTIAKKPVAAIESEEPKPKTLAQRVNDFFVGLSREEDGVGKDLSYRLSQARLHGQADMVAEIEELATISAMKAHGLLCAGQGVLRKANEAVANAERAAK